MRVYASNKPFKLWSVLAKWGSRGETKRRSPSSQASTRLSIVYMIRLGISSLIDIGKKPLNKSMFSQKDKKTEKT